jgi:phytoene dehydrogenase-like protein
MPDSYDVVIAGAGIAGLTLAALLADGDDCSVLLVEKNEAAGGRFHVEHRAGYLVDWGVHACLLGSRGAIGSVLSRCENPPSIVPAGAAIYRDGKILPFLGKSLATLARQRVFSKGDLLRLGVDALRVRGADWERISLSEWAAGRRASPSLDGAMRALCTGLLPTDQFEKASSGELFAFLRQAMRSMVALGYPVGGWGAVLDALVSAVERSTKCQLVLGAELERIIAPAGRVERVMVGGRELRARAVVCAFPPQQLAGGGFVEPGLPSEYAGTLASLEEGTGIFIDIGLESPVTSDDRLVMALEPPALLWAVSNVSPEVAPPGRQLLQLFSPIKNRDRDDDDFKLQRTGELIDLAERVFGGALREEWRRVVVSTIVGVVPFTNQGMHSRPDIPVPGFDGIFLVGDGVRAPGLGGDLAARSAIIAERLVRGCLERKRE